MRSTFFPVLAMMLFLGQTVAVAITRNGFDLDGALVPESAIQRGGPPRDGIPSIDRPRFVSADQAVFLREDDRVLGLNLDGQARAYPIRILNWHEIVNDRFNNRPVVVTYCPLCGTGAVFDARIADSDRSFGVSGLLYNSDVLLYDRESESLWSQIGKQAVTGPLRGQRLTMLPADHTSWADWRSRHPGTLVLSTETGFRRDYSRDPYAGYGSTAAVWFPLTHRDNRLPAKELVLGLSVDGEHKAYPFSVLDRLPDHSLDDRLAGHAFSVRYDPQHRTARAIARDGSPLPGLIAYWFAWAAFHPDTAIQQ